MILMFSFNSCASELFAIEDEYDTLTEKFEQSYMGGDAYSAMQASLKQLSIDPSDSVAFLRLALSIRDSCEQVKPYYSQFGSAGDFEEIRHIARLIIQKECGVLL